MVEQAIRLKYNADLAQKLMVDLNVVSRYPKVTDQLPVFPLEPGRLVAHGYNPSIIREGDHLLMAYRYHDGNTLSTRLALAQIAMDGKVLSNRSIEGPPDVSMEDPKLFMWGKDIWILWVESTWPKLPLSSVVKWGKLVEGKILDIATAAHTNPKPLEKNHVPFILDGHDFLLIYSCSPTQEICSVAEGRLIPQHTCHGFWWPWGPPRGGTVPLPFDDGKLIRFFHSGADNEFGPQRRRYFMGAVIHEGKPPFAPVAWSKSPILSGSEISDLPDDKRPFHYKPMVVFPGGAVAHGKNWLVSVGVNDSECRIVEVTRENLHL